RALPRPHSVRRERTAPDALAVADRIRALLAGDRLGFAPRTDGSGADADQGELLRLLARVLLSGAAALPSNRCAGGGDPGDGRVLGRRNALAALEPRAGPPRSAAGDPH